VSATWSNWSGSATCRLAVHQYRGMPYQEYSAGVEAIFRNHRGRPHWGSSTPAPPPTPPLSTRWGTASTRCGAGSTPAASS
jgi:hypothetical protein